MVSPRLNKRKYWFHRASWIKISSQYDLPDLPQYHLPELRGRQDRLGKQGSENITTVNRERLIREQKRGFFEKIIDDFIEPVGQFCFPGFEFREPF